MRAFRGYTKIVTMTPLHVVTLTAQKELPGLYPRMIETLAPLHMATLAAQRELDVDSEVCYLHRYLVLITRIRVEYGRIFHEQYFHEPKVSVNIRVKCPAIIHDDKCNKLFILT